MSNAVFQKLFNQFHRYFSAVICIGYNNSTLVEHTDNVAVKTAILVHLRSPR